MATEEDLGPRLSSRLTYRLKRALMDLEGLHEHHLGPSGISGRELAVLLFLDGREPESQQQAAARLGIDRTTTSAIGKRLPQSSKITGSLSAEYSSLLFGDYSPHGTLPWQLPRSVDQILKPGGGDNLADAVEHWDLPYDLGATDAERADITAKISAGQTVPTTYGDPLYPYGAGMQGW